MKNIKSCFPVLTGVTVALGVLLQNAAATTINDMTMGTNITINSGIFKTTDFQTAGTGVIQPFVRVQQNGNEAGYNTSLGTPLNDDASWNKDLLLSSLQSVTVGGKSYYEFRLDINQSGSTKSSQITLNQVEIFGNNSPASASGVGVDGTTGQATGTSGLGTLLWSMNPGGDAANAILLDFDLNKGGSGQGDMQMFIPTSYFLGQTYVVLYSQFGVNPIPNGTASDSGFEEWAALQGTNNGTSIPEPSTVIAGALLLVPLGVQAYRRLRK
jgi:hypothetical protein